jgi:parallel beta-helix repeat protein
MSGEKHLESSNRDIDDYMATHYEFDNGVKIDSNKPVSIYGDYLGSSMIIYFNASDDSQVTSADIIIDGLAPSTRYHIYMDNYHNEIVYDTGSSGLYRFTVDLSDYHVVFFHVNPYIVFLSDSGWSDQAFGNWDSVSKTASLTKNVSATIQIDSDDIVLNGKGYIINGSDKDLLFGVYIPDKFNVSVQNIKVTNCRDGVSLYNCNECFLKQCFCARNKYGISNNLSNKTNITQNRTEYNSIYGIKLYKSITSSVNENILSMSGSFAVDCEKSTFSNVAINGFYNNSGGGIRFREYSFESILEKNLFVNNDCGISLESYCFNCRILSNILYSSLLAASIDSCHAIDVMDNDFLMGNGDGVNISSSDGCTIKENSCTLNRGSGISSRNTHRIDISSNTISSNSNSGVELQYCDNCIISSNDVKFNNLGGIELYYSHFNSISGNNIQENRIFGLQTKHANSNDIYNNNFIDNDRQVNDLQSINKFSKAKPDGGNYWSDFSLNDANRDTIVEQPYKVSKKNIDEMPWTREGAWMKSPLNKKVGVQNINLGPGETLKSSELLKKNANTLIT